MKIDLILFPSPHKNICFGLILILFVSSVLAGTDDTVFSSKEKNEILDKVGRLLAENYVDPEIGDTCRLVLNDKNLRSDINANGHPRSFLKDLNAQLLKVHNDKHIRVSFIPPEEQRLDETQPAVSILLQTSEKQYRNFGFEQVKILAENIGYINLTTFAPADLARDRVKNTLDFMQFCDALIFDLRQNRGGSLDMVKLLAGYFFADSTYFSSYYWRRGDYVEEYWTVPDSSRKSFWDIPLFILTSKKTFSAAEDFAYGMQSRKRAKLIGEQTGGGANPGFTFSINQRFSIFIPTGRAINPVSSNNWETRGLNPEIKTSANNAINIAVEQASFAARSHRHLQNNQLVANYQDLVTLLEDENTRLLYDHSRVDSTLYLLLTSNMLDEWTINRLGYHYMGKKKYKIVEKLFSFNLRTFPESVNAHDSMGEYYYRTDQYKLAAEYYEKVLLIDSKHQNARFMLDKISIVGW